MKKILLTALFTIGLFSCSSDNGETMLPQNDNPNEPIAQEYKMFVYSTNLDEGDFTYKTKTGNGPWVEHQLQNWRFPVKYGDSVHVDSGANSHPTQQTHIKMQINNIVDWYDARNQSYQLLTTYSNQRLDRKFKIGYE